MTAKTVSKKESQCKPARRSPAIQSQNKRPLLTFVLEDFWITSTYCPLCCLLFLSLSTVPGYLTQACRKKPPGWVCHVISRQERGRVVSGNTAVHLDTRQLILSTMWLCKSWLTRMTMKRQIVYSLLLILVFVHGPPLVGRHLRSGYVCPLT